MIAADLNPVVVALWKNLLHNIMMGNRSSIVRRLNRKLSHLYIMFSRVETKVSDQLIMLITIALFFMIVGEPIESV
jgi:hypothetical protein